MFRTTSIATFTGLAIVTLLASQADAQLFQRFRARFRPQQVYCPPQPRCYQAPVMQQQMTTPQPVQSWSVSPDMSTSGSVVESESPSPAEKSLYDRLGGVDAITAVVDDFVGRAAANPKVNFTRAGTEEEWEATPENVAKLKKNLVDFVGMATGGPQKYTGKSMKEAHAGMKITSAEFAAIAADLTATLNKFNVPAKEQSELMQAVGGTRGDIVEVDN